MSEQITVEFCPECSKNIRSCDLHKLWRGLAVHYVINGNMFHVEHDATDILKYCEILEKKGYFLTHEVKDKTLLHIKGVFRTSPDSYLICIDRDKHSQN